MTLAAWWPLGVVIGVIAVCFETWQAVGPITKLTITVGWILGFAVLIYFVSVESGHVLPPNSPLGMYVLDFYHERVLTLPYDTRGYMIPVILAVPELIGGFLGLLVGGGK